VEEAWFSKARPAAGWYTVILVAHSENFAVAIAKAREEEEIAILDAEHSRGDLTQGFSATCNPGPLCEPRPSNPHMSDFPSSPTGTPCYRAAEA
jgi:hypothetical protein